MPSMEPLLRWLGLYIHPLKTLDFFQAIIADILNTRRSDPNQQVSEENVIQEKT